MTLVQPKWKRLAAILIAILVMSSCSSATREGVSASSSFHALRPVWSDEVARGVPLHVKAKILSREVMRNQDDPYFPKHDPKLLELVGEDWITVWHIEVMEWLKGFSAEHLRVVDANNGQHPPPGSLKGEDDGGLCVFYLSIEPIREGFNPWGTRADVRPAESNLAAGTPRQHWILEHAEPVEVGEGPNESSR